MAKSNYNSLNLWRGRIAGQVYKAVRGKQVISTYVPGRNPNTMAQQLVRAKLTVVAKLTRVFRYVIRLGFAEDAGSKRSIPIARFIKHNFGNISGDSPDIVSLDPSKIILAEGSRTGATFNPVLDIDTQPGEVVIGITNAVSPYEDEQEDLVFGVLYAPDLKQAILSEGVARTSNKIRMALPTDWTGIEIHAYGFVIGGQNLQASPSRYIGHVNLD